MITQEAAMAQEQTKRGGGGGDDDDPTASTAAGQERREKLTEETDDLLDEIDDVLEENAEDFVRAYVQKGGRGPGRTASSWPSRHPFQESLPSLWTCLPFLTCCAVRRQNFSLSTGRVPVTWCPPLLCLTAPRSSR